LFAHSKISVQSDVICNFLNLENSTLIVKMVLMLGISGWSGRSEDGVTRAEEKIEDTACSIGDEANHDNFFSL
jgi:hypothetical protein